MIQFLRDVWLEWQINVARVNLQQACGPVEQRRAWLVIADLIKQRSPEQVRRMERKARLL